MLKDAGVRIDRKALIDAALWARERAYAPYSGFPVGAALLGESGNVYLGCNVENASYGLTWCAERTAIGNAIASGERRFVAIAIVAATPGPCAPCGACRQALVEFGEAIRVIMANVDGAIEEKTAGELLPEAFGPQALSKEGRNP